MMTLKPDPVGIRGEVRRSLRVVQVLDDAAREKQILLDTQITVC